jgi:hypothetical protein
MLRFFDEMRKVWDTFSQVRRRPLVLVRTKGITQLHRKKPNESRPASCNEKRAGFLQQYLICDLCTQADRLTI